jgi:hypothetical protein
MFKHFFLLHSIQFSFRVYPAYYPVGTGGKWVGCEADHLHASCAKVNNAGAVPPLPHKSSWCSAKLNVNRDNLTFTLPSVNTKSNAIHTDYLTIKHI